MTKPPAGPSLPSTSPSLWTVVVTAATWGATVCMLYAALFALYAIAHATGFVWAAQPAQPAATLAAFDVTLLYLSIFFGAILILVAAPLGAFTALLIQVVLGHFRTPWPATFTGAGVAVVVCIAIGLYVPTLFGDRMSPSAYPATFWFWLGLPALVYVLTAALGAAQVESATSLRTPARDSSTHKAASQT